MGYAEKRGNTWRARWRSPSGVLESKNGFTSKRAAENHARDQEAAIRGGTYVDHRAGQITLSEWVNIWFPAQDLEPSTLSNYRYLIEVLILPVFGDRALTSLTAEEIAIWEQGNVARGYSRRTAQDARSTLGTVLADAIPRYLQVNPAARRKGKGRKGQRRVERMEKATKVWATPLQVLLVAERCATLSSHEADFVMMVTTAYTGMRWSEINALSPGCLHDDTIDVHWKLYELNGKFYHGRPKDGSVRTIDLPPFLAALLATHLKAASTLVRCTCNATEPPWCLGTDQYVFLGPKGGHHRRSGYARRTVRPAADGWYPAAGSRPAMPVLVDATVPPGKLLTPWPATEPGRAFAPPRGRGRARIPDQTPVASWLPVLRDLTPHGLRHGHQTWMDEAAVPYVLQSERMGHEVPGMRGVYAHISPAMRTHLVDALEEMWRASLSERARMHPRSSVAALDDLLKAY